MKKILMALLLVSSSAMASGYKCNYEGSQREMNACAIQDFKAADAELNAAYKRKMQMLHPKQQQVLRLQQRTWIQRRDARCKSKKYGEGTNVTIDYLTCLQSFTEVRTLQLR